MHSYMVLCIKPWFMALYARSGVETPKTAENCKKRFRKKNGLETWKRVFVKTHNYKHSLYKRIHSIQVNLR